MLFKRPVLERIAAGEVTLAFRRWRRPSVRPGGTLRTPAGLLAIDAVDPVDTHAVTDADARRAGYSSRNEVIDELAARDDGKCYRIAFRLVGPDPRLDLRANDTLSSDDLDAIRSRLARLDRASAGGPWTQQTLAVIAERPCTRAADLASALGTETQPFKRNVRKLKDLGLTESLDVGYRLSPRGRAFLEYLGRGQHPGLEHPAPERTG